MFCPSVGDATHQEKYLMEKHESHKKTYIQRFFAREITDIIRTQNLDDVLKRMSVLAAQNNNQGIDEYRIKYQFEYLYYGDIFLSPMEDWMR